MCFFNGGWGWGWEVNFFIVIVLVKRENKIENRFVLKERSMMTF